METNENKNEKKINIGIFCDSFFPMVDGVINVIDNYAKRLIKYANVTVFVPQGRGDYVDNFPYKVVRCNKRFKCPGLDYDLPLPELDPDFMDEIKNSNLDIVHIHSPFSIGKIGVKYAKKHNIPVVATCHSQFKKDFFEATKSDVLTAIAMGNIMPTFEKCDECWAVNKEVAKLYHNEYKLKIMPKVKNNGTEMQYLDDKQAVLDLRNQLGIKDNEKVLLFVGRLNILKNIFFIADALKVLKDKNFAFKMIFVGTGPDEADLKKYITELELDDKVIFAGKIMDRKLIKTYYNLADLFVFPSLYDCSSLVQIEAASQKTPTLFLRGAVTSGTCTENVDAYFSENDSTKYANKIIDIFSDNDEYERISNGAFTNLYVSWDDAVEKIYNDYLEVIEKYKTGHFEKLKEFAKVRKLSTKKISAKRKVETRKTKRKVEQYARMKKKVLKNKEKIVKKQQKLEKNLQKSNSARKKSKIAGVK